MEKPVKQALHKLRSALRRLRDGVSAARNQLDKDGVIQRFEFSFELTWKALKIFLESEGFDSKSPKDCLKAAFRLGLLDDDEIFLDMLADRNKTSHLYSKQEAGRVFKRIKRFYLP